MKKITFVCTGNTCRSPMAAAVFNYLAASEAEFGYTADSAGLAVSENALSSVNAVSALNDSLGIDLGEHRARLLSQTDIEEADLILAMTRSHKQYILSMFPGAHQKTFTLKEYVYNTPEVRNKSGTTDARGYSADIADPYGRSVWSYKQCLGEIISAVEKLIGKLKKEESKK